MRFGKYSSRYNEILAGRATNIFDCNMASGSLMDIGVYTVEPMVEIFGMPSGLTSMTTLLDPTTRQLTHGPIDGCGSILASYGGGRISVELAHSKITNDLLPSQIEGERGTIQIDHLSTPRNVRIDYRGDVVRGSATEPPREQSDNGRVLDLPIDALRPNPNQPRIEFDEASLRSLSDSIRRYDILQPLTVRRTDEGYELIAGERRLRAAKLAGLREVPCLLARSSEEESALLALIENLQRRDLHYLEEAAAIARLIATYGLSQEQAAERLGKSQSAIANKLRLLRLSPDCVRLLREHDLSERHARALLRLTDEEDRLKALQVIAARGYNVAQSEAYIEELLKLKQKTPPPRLPTYIVKDVRIFLNTIRHSLGLMQRAGVEADMQREDTDDGILLTIRIPKRAKEAG